MLGLFNQSTDLYFLLDTLRKAMDAGDAAGTTLFYVSLSALSLNVILRVGIAMMQSQMVMFSKDTDQGSCWPKAARCAGFAGKSMRTAPCPGSCVA